MAPSKHLIVCGLPRSGSTLLYAMMRRSASDALFLDREQSAATTIGEDDAAGFATIVTKRPKDIFDLDTIIANKPAGKELSIIVTVRDPRAVLCSTHGSYPAQPFIGFDRSLFLKPETTSFTDPGLLDYAAAIDRALQRDDAKVMLLRYEDLLDDPDGCRERISALTGLALDRPFDGLEQAGVSPRFDKALNGARALDPTRATAWTRSGAHVVRQFRLAPALFAALDHWGYEGDAAWLERLAAENPEGLDDRRGLIVGYHTDDPGYAREARRLRASLARLDLPVALTCIAAADWLSVVRGKVAFLREQRAARRGPLLYVDVDAFFHGDPWPYLNGITADAAWASLRDGKSRSGTLYLADTPGAVAFLEDWQARLDAAPAAWDQAPLNDIVRETRESTARDYRVHLLPPAYCHIFDRAEALGARGAAPVIEHLQASRDLTSPGSAKQQRREQRIAEIEAMPGLFDIVGSHD